MVVRRREGVDLPGCVDALKAVHLADGYPTCWPLEPTAWLSPAGTVAAWVAEDAGTIAGHVCMVAEMDDEAAASHAGVSSEQLAKVSRLFVAPMARGQGLGASLLDAVTFSASSLGLKLMLDVVDDGGPAVALYDRLGWRLVERRLADWTTPAGERLPVGIYVAPPGNGSTVL